MINKEIYERFAAIIKPKALERWWGVFNEKLDGVPSELVKTEQGKKKLIHVLYILESGVPG